MEEGISEHIIRTFQKWITKNKDNRTNSKQYILFNDIITKINIFIKKYVKVK